MREAEVRWNIKVSRETDLALRAFLGSRRMSNVDLSRFVEEAVRWSVFHRTVQNIQARNAAADPDELQQLVDDAVLEVRTERRAKARARKT